MADPSRPTVTGYPFTTNGGNQTAPPPSGTAYPYSAPPPQPTNPYYYNAYNQQQPYANQRAIVFRRFMTALIAVIVIFFTIIFICWLVIRPHPPEFHVTSLSLTNFNASNTTSSVTGNWNARFEVYNPNKKMTISYDELETWISYKSESLSEARIPPFKQGKKDVTDVGVVFSAVTSYVDRRVVDGINNDKTHGAVSFNIRVDAVTGFKVGGFRARRRLVRVYCDNVAVGISGNGGSGNLTGGERPCRVYA